MTIQVGDYLPDINVYEFIEQATDDLPAGPKVWRLPDLAMNKKIIIVGIVGAFTPICSGNHIPGYLEHYDDFKQKGIDEIWCISVNDPFVMAAWAKTMHTDGKVRMLADGSAELCEAIDLALDLSDRGMGLRSHRFALIVNDGLITNLSCEDTGEYTRTDSESILNLIR